MLLESVDKIAKDSEPNKNNEALVREQEHENRDTATNYSEIDLSYDSKLIQQAPIETNGERSSDRVLNCGDVAGAHQETERENESILGKRSATKLT
jgi:hypothetical protein